MYIYNCFRQEKIFLFLQYDGNCLDRKTHPKKTLEYFDKTLLWWDENFGTDIAVGMPADEYGLTLS